MAKAKSTKGSGIVHDTSKGGLNTEHEFTRERGKGESDTPQEVDENMVEQQRLQIKAQELGLSVDEVKELEAKEAKNAEDTSEEDEK